MNEETKQAADDQTPENAQNDGVSEDVSQTVQPTKTDVPPTSDVSEAIDDDVFEEAPTAELERPADAVTQEAAVAAKDADGDGAAEGADASTAAAEPDEAAPAKVETDSTGEGDPKAAESKEPAGKKGRGRKGKGKKSEREDKGPSNDPEANPYYELRQLMELAVKYPEIGPPLAELAFKIGHSDIGERIVKMGLDDDDNFGVEFYAVAVDAARREGRYEDVFAQVQEALDAFDKTADEAIDEDAANRLLHLVRNGFNVLLFDLEDVNAKPSWVNDLGEKLSRLESRYEKDAFFFSLLAQATWFADKEKSESIWDRAIEIAEGDFAWNARGTWYKDAADDFDRAQAAYRKGLETHSNSALLLHNLAQLLTDEAKKKRKEDPESARMWLKEADELVRRALRQKTRRGLRRYIHGTKDRIRKLLSKLPVEAVEPPKVDDKVEARVVALAPYGAFVTIAGGFKGLLHNSEIAWERVNKPDDFLTVGDAVEVKVISVEPQDDGSMRISFSRKQLLDKPEGFQEQKGGGKDDNRRNNRRGKGGSGRRGGNKKKGGRGGNQRNSHRESPKSDGGIGSLGEMLLAKLEEAKEDK